MAQLLISLVGIILVVALGWLFLEISQPGKRTVPVLIMVVAIAAGVLLRRVFPPLALFMPVLGIVISFLVAAHAKSSSQPGRDRHLH